jgi:hypothetical protein
MRNLFFLRIVWVLLIIGTQTSGIYSQKMPEAANKLYQDFAAAIKGSDIAALESVTCKSSIIRSKNQVISMGMSYPKDLLDMMNMGLLDFHEFTYLDFKKSGPTINAWYLYDNHTELSIVTLCILEEEGKLKIIELKVRDAHDFIMNLQKNDHSFLKLAEFQPSGVAPEVPTVVEKIDHVAYIDINCYGYTVSATVNGYFQLEVKNSGTSGIVLGGIKKGENTIELTIEKTDPNEKELPAIGIRALIDGKTEEVFYLNEDIAGKINRTFTVK